MTGLSIYEGICWGLVAALTVVFAMAAWETWGGDDE